MADSARFQQYVLPHLDAGYNLARWLAQDAHDAEDVVQEACERALRYGGAMRPEQARSWFLTVVRNAYYDWSRRNRPAALVGGDDAGLDALPDPAAPDPEQWALRGDAARHLGDALGALPLPMREVLVLRELEDLSYEEIARVLALPIGTVMSRLARARKALQQSPRLRELAGAPT